MVEPLITILKLHPTEEQAIDLKNRLLSLPPGQLFEVESMVYRYLSILQETPTPTPTS